MNEREHRSIQPGAKEKESGVDEIETESKWIFDGEHGARWNEREVRRKKDSKKKEQSE